MPRPKKALPPGLEGDTCAPETVGFRLELQYRMILGERAAKLGVSAHDLAKLYVTERILEAQEREALRVAVKATNEDLQTLREDLAYAVKALLSSAGKLTKDQSKAWVEEHIQPK
ncbi:MAG: hypothetical protein AB9869_03680 [Verrucomicrobiia bacterium]